MRIVPHHRDRVAVVDVFAGPGGLGEGFSRVEHGGRRRFQSVLSIEKDEAAFRTLTLRAFYRQFDPGEVPEEYFQYIGGDEEMPRERLFERYPVAAAAAKRETWRAELATDQFPVDLVREYVKTALGGERQWVLLGGPPCQAYSLVGRSRNRGIRGYRLEKDHRAKLYVEYLQLIADFLPAVFVMENVKGLLSARLEGEPLFERILDDLSDPATAIRREGRSSLRKAAPRYDLHPVIVPEGLFGASGSRNPADFVVRAERHGVPQARHRVIVVGIRRDLGLGKPEYLAPRTDAVSVGEVIGDLPRLRSGLSEGADSEDAWASVIARLGRKGWQSHIAAHAGEAVARRVAEIADRAVELSKRPRRKREQRPCVKYQRSWYEADVMPCVTNHESRTHMDSDLHRYLFAAAFAEANERSPDLRDFPKQLLPDHDNARDVAV